MTENEWMPIETANKYASSIRLRLASGIELDGFWHDQLIDDHGRDCGAWAAVGEEYPASWTDGICWTSNEDCVPSDPPTHWKPA
jgi:hypothetical protein